MQFCHTTQWHRCLMFWGSVQLACWLQEYPPELLPDHLMSTISHLKCRFREFGCTSIRPHNRRPRVWRPVGERFVDVNVVNRVPYGDGGVIVCAGISYGQRTQLHFIDGNFNAQKYREEILSPIVRPISFKVSVTNRCISVFPVMWNP